MIRTRTFGPTVACVAFALLCGAAFGTDVAFWQEYKPAADDLAMTYLLLQFDAAPLKPDGGPIAGVALTGDAALDPAGRFGSCLRVGGTGGVTCTPNEVFAGGFISIEAWVKLEKYPEKEGFIVFRPAQVDGSPKYDPAVDVTKGFALLVDRAGALHMDVTNVYYGRRCRTSSPPAAVPLGRWVHVAGTCGGFPISRRVLYVDGREAAGKPLGWGEGLVVHGDEEKKPGALYIGNNDRGDAGLAGLIDQVRVHRNIYAFWPEPDNRWTEAAASRPIPDGPPNFVESHRPAVYVPLDGDTQASSTIAGLKVAAEGPYVPGVRGRALAGQVTLSAKGLTSRAEGSLEFWMQPIGINNWSDRNRSFVGGPFVYYLFNSGSPGRRNLALYFDTPAGNHFVQDRLDTDVYPGRWYHVLIVWRGARIAVYLDGRLSGETLGTPLAESRRTTTDAVTLNPSGVNAAVDELRLYPKALLPEEAANAYWRYRDPSRMTGKVEEPAFDLAFEYLPSEKTVYYVLTPAGSQTRIGRVRFALKGPDGKTTVLGEMPFRPRGELRLPELPEGLYTLEAAPVEAGGAAARGASAELAIKRFAWTGNDLGAGREVYAPFTPVEVKGPAVTVVSRTMVVNGFGLWDSVRSLGRELLAAPMRLRYETRDGEGRWSSAEARAGECGPDQAVFGCSAKAPALSVETRASIEMDGCMKVEMTLSPGAAPAEITRLWVDIPLRDAECPLMHTIGDGLRHNHAGRVPGGAGAVWNGSTTARSRAWRNNFVPYIWLGGAERGLAFFAENDRGWVTQSGDKVPTHELVREGDRLTLRAYLVNRPVTLRESRSLVFGLQASPTKPMPPDWRRKLPLAPGGLAVVPWGGLQCASQLPFADDWTIVSRLLEARSGKPFDRKWFEAYARERQTPLVHGYTEWAGLQGHFAGNIARAGENKPIAVYQEEMAACTARPEWLVYQDEWKANDGPDARSAADGIALDGGQTRLGSPRTVTFCRSYADFGVWVANEWLRRGVSLYWDNTYPKLATNTRTTAAYAREDGAIQPCLVLWNQREYQKRVWRVLAQQRASRPEPLEWTLHMTNTLLLPIHTWGTVDLDNELSRDTPFPTDYILAETIGRQVGNYGLSLYAISGQDNAVLARLPAARREGTEWAMRAVHELQRAGGGEKLLQDFGYGKESVTVHNYWEDRPALSCDRGDVKWLVLADREKRAAMIVLASWSQPAVEAKIRLAADVLGIEPADLVVGDAEHPEQTLGGAAGEFAVPIDGPWGYRVLLARPR